MKLYICSIAEFTELPGQELLTLKRRERMERFTLKEDKARCLAAGLLLRYALGDRAETLAYNSHGKPYLPDGDICFNLSHSGDLVVLAVDKDELGVDVERIRPHPRAVAQRCFTGEERQWLYAQRDADLAFFTLWTGKESVMKAEGLGFSLSPDSFSLMPVENGAHMIKDRRWFVNWYAVDGCALCVSSKNDERAQAIILDRKQLLR